MTMPNFISKVYPERSERSVEQPRRRVRYRGVSVQFIPSEPRDQWRCSEEVTLRAARPLILRFAQDELDSFRSHGTRHFVDFSLSRVKGSVEVQRGSDTARCPSADP